MCQYLSESVWEICGAVVRVSGFYIIVNSVLNGETVIWLEYGIVGMRIGLYVLVVLFFLTFGK